MVCSGPATARPATQSIRFLQHHLQVEHLEVVVVVPHERLKLGPAKPLRHLQVFLNEVAWVSLEELGHQPDLDPLLNLLMLQARPEAELGTSAARICYRQFFLYWRSGFPT